MLQKLLVKAQTFHLLSADHKAVKGAGSLYFEYLYENEDILIDNIFILRYIHSIRISILILQLII